MLIKRPYMYGLQKTQKKMKNEKKIKNILLDISYNYVCYQKADESEIYLLIDDAIINYSLELDTQSKINLVYEVCNQIFYDELVNDLFYLLKLKNQTN